MEIIETTIKKHVFKTGCNLVYTACLNQWLERVVF